MFGQTICLGKVARLQDGLFAGSVLRYGKRLGDNALQVKYVSNHQRVLNDVERGRLATTGNNISVLHAIGGLVMRNITVLGVYFLIHDCEPFENDLQKFTK